MIAQLFRFGIVGVMATLVHVGIATLFERAFPGLGQRANLTGYACGMLVSYLGHHRFTFALDGNHRAHVPRFLVVSFSGLAVSSLITYVVFQRLGQPFWQAMALVVLLVPPTTFVVSKFWAFTARPAPDRWSGGVLAGLVSGGFLAVFWGRYINHDVAWYLVAVEKWLNGAVPYVDLIEVNPPLNFYLMVPGVVIADITGISKSNGEYVFVALVLFASLAWVWRILGQTALSLPRQQLFLLGAGAAVLLPAAANIGQREHLMLILALPYFTAYLALLAPDRGWQGAGRALVAAVGLSIKPFFMLFPLLLTLVMLVRLRSMRALFSAANLTILVFGLVYVGYSLWAHPAYFDRIIPTALLVYGDYTLGTETILARLHPTYVLVFALMLVPVWHRRDGQFGAALLGAALGVYLVQWNGFTYHLLPLWSMAMLLGMWFVLQAGAHPVARILGVVSLALTGLVSVQGGFYLNWAVTRLAPAFDDAPRPAKLLVMSSELAVGFPLVLEQGAVWTSRYHSLWLIPGAVNKLAKTDCQTDAALCETLQSILDRTRGEIVDDFAATLPDVLIIDKRALFFDSETFDYLPFLSADPRFADLIARYAPETETPYYTIWKPR